ncbi:unnamed protein product [Mesocestoides corti]|uniref:Succinate-semialdehyde dehydrogenase, mitochondrial n=1 Tax=Mesocestoides corti TaxID=53468 RepID=A0A158QTM1_MESCO|nr:unnamed protein product [Mesocestoides corti]
MHPRAVSFVALHNHLRRRLSSYSWSSLVPEKKAFIGGNWVSGSLGKTFPVINPATEQQIAEVPCIFAQEVDCAIEAAAEAQKTWAVATVGTRASVIEGWANSIERNASVLAELITAENGKVDVDARGEIASAVSGLRWYANEARSTCGQIIPSTHVPGRRLLVFHQPVGVVGMITPWNFPLSMFTRKAGAALAAGCSVVLKPAEETPLTALAAVYLASAEAGLDGRLLSVVTAPREDADMVGKAFCSHHLIRQIGFTGSTSVGKKLYAAAAANMKRAQLELGGNAPFIVFESADLDLAVSQVIASKFRCSGQTCVCANRILVQDSIYDTFVDMLTTAVSGLVLGEHQGPLINRAALTKVPHLFGAVCPEGRFNSRSDYARSTDQSNDQKYGIYIINPIDNVNHGCLVTRLSVILGVDLTNSHVIGRTVWYLSITRA